MFGVLLVRADWGKRGSGITMQTLAAAIHQAPGTKWRVAHHPETGTTTQGRTVDAALANLRAATELCRSESPCQPKGARC